MEEQIKSNVIEHFDSTQFMNGDITIGELGCIISKKYNNRIIYLPKIKGKGHDDSIRFLFLRLFPEYKDLFKQFYNNYFPSIPKAVQFMDNIELVYAIFLASIGEIVIFNAGYANVLCALLIAPDDANILTEEQKQLFLYSIEHMEHYDNEGIAVASLNELNNRDNFIHTLDAENAKPYFQNKLALEKNNKLI